MQTLVKILWALVFVITTCKNVNNVKQKSYKQIQLECGPMPKVMAALPNIGGALYSMPQSFADAH